MYWDTIIIFVFLQLPNGGNAFVWNHSSFLKPCARRGTGDAPSATATRIAPERRRF